MTTNDDPVRQALEVGLDFARAALVESQALYGGYPRDDCLGSRVTAAERDVALFEAALSTLPQAAAAVPLSEEQIVAIGLANKLDPWRSSVVDPVKFARGIEAAHGITPPEGASQP